METKTITIGIDPGGSSGSIAIIKDNALEVFRMKGKTEQEIESFISSSWNGKEVSTKFLAIIERVHSMPKQSSQSGFTFGQNYGLLRGCLIANKIPFQESTPKNWQKYYSMVKSKTESKTEWKKRLLQIAQNLYPETKIHLECGDAVLIAHYCKSLIK